jgi:hypothetical protein
VVALIRPNFPFSSHWGFWPGHLLVHLPLMWSWDESDMWTGREDKNEYRNLTLKFFGKHFLQDWKADILIMATHSGIGHSEETFLSSQIMYSLYLSFLLITLSIFSFVYYLSRLSPILPLSLSPLPAMSILSPPPYSPAILHFLPTLFFLFNNLTHTIVHVGSEVTC